MGTSHCPVCHICIQSQIPDDHLSYSPQTKEELFNLRHAFARNTIEHILGILKCRFRILLLPAEFSLEVQLKIPAALCVVHNFIRTHDPLDDDEDEDVTDEEDNGNNNNRATENGVEGNRGDGTHEMCDQIADAVWTDYLDLRRQRQLLQSDGGDSDDDSTYDD